MPSNLPGWQPQPFTQPIPRPLPLTHQESVSSEDSWQAEGDPGDPEFSEDGVLPDKPAFATLFRPSVFRTLFRKAKTATNMGSIVNPQDQDQGALKPQDKLFAVPTPDHDFIPCPELFSEVIKRQWDQPGALSAPTGHDKKIFCADPVLEGLLTLPMVDPPVVGLTSSTVLSNDVVEVLRQRVGGRRFPFARPTKRQLGP